MISLMLVTAVYCFFIFLWVYIATLLGFGLDSTITRECAACLGVVWMTLFTYPIYVLSRQYRKNPFRDAGTILLHSNPRWLRRLFYALWLYAGLNCMVIEYYYLEGGTLEAINGEWVLAVHGHVIKTVTEEAAARLQIYEDRMIALLFVALYSFLIVFLIGLIQQRAYLPKGTPRQA